MSEQVMYTLQVPSAQAIPLLWKMLEVGQPDSADLTLTCQATNAREESITFDIHVAGCETAQTLKLFSSGSWRIECVQMLGIKEK